MSTGAELGGIRDGATRRSIERLARPNVWYFDGGTGAMAAVTDKYLNHTGTNSTVNPYNDLAVVSGRTRFNVRFRGVYSVNFRYEMSGGTNDSRVVFSVWRAGTERIVDRRRFVLTTAAGSGSAPFFFYGTGWLEFSVRSLDPATLDRSFVSIKFEGGSEETP